MKSHRTRKVARGERVHRGRAGQTPEGRWNAEVTRHGDKILCKMLSTDPFQGAICTLERKLQCLQVNDRAILWT